VFALAAVLLIGLAGVVVVARNAQRGRYGQVYGEAPSTVAVGRGGRFSLAVADRGASVGDRWAAELRPAEAVTLARSELVAGNLLDRLTGPAVGGGGGTRYFTFDARRPGSVTIMLRNCYRGCDDEATRAQSREVTWTVTVR
jgi:hypothetical protein